MKRSKLWLLLILVLIGWGYFVFGSVAFRAAPLSEPVIATSWEQAWADDFEVESNWSLFEEIVAGNPCYGAGIGSVARSNAVAYGGDYSLLVWANAAQSLLSNHLIGYKTVYPVGQFGIWRYEVHAYLPEVTQQEGETGPEFSLQNTRWQTPTATFLTATAGIQYISNTDSPLAHHWNVWHEVAPGVAGWDSFLIQPLTTGIWYTLTVEADYTQNVYHTFTLTGGGLQIESDLAAYPIAQEDKGFTNEAFVVTVESENRWNNCGTAGVFDNQLHYDEVRLYRQHHPLYLPLLWR
jgi:hypothetical protein